MNQPPPPQPAKIRSPEEIQKELEGLIKDQETTLKEMNLLQVQEEEETDLESKKYYEIELLKAQVEKFKDDNQNRKSFASSVFTVTVIWMFVVILIVYGCGIGKLNLSDTVLVTLITTTTANVFGFLYVVVTYLFNKDKST